MTDHHHTHLPFAVIQKGGGGLMLSRLLQFIIGISVQAIDEAKRALRIMSIHDGQRTMMMGRY